MLMNEFWEKIRKLDIVLFMSMKNIEDLFRMVRKKPLILNDQIKERQIKEKPRIRDLEIVNITLNDKRRLIEIFDKFFDKNKSLQRMMRHISMMIELAKRESKKELSEEDVLILIKKNVRVLIEREKGYKILKSIIKKYADGRGFNYREYHLLNMVIEIMSFVFFNRIKE